MMTKDEFSREYSSRIELFNSFSRKLQQSLEKLLKRQGVSYDSVPFRVKGIDSGYQRIEEKKLENPFVELLDWCGLRVICYYLSDIALIGNIISAEFDVINADAVKDRMNKLKVNEFGYRSTHYIIKMKDAWLATPEYQDFKGIIAEVQVRTISMHAWAQIEHGLQYKPKEGGKDIDQAISRMPWQFRRKIYQLSAKFEEADDQFQNLRESLQKHYAELALSDASLDEFKNRELDINSLQEFITDACPGKIEIDGQLNNLFIRLKQVNGLTMQHIVNAFKVGRDYVEDVHIATYGAMPEHIKRLLRTTYFLDQQVYVLEVALLIGSDRYYLWKYRDNFNLSPVPHPELTAVNEARVRIGRKTGFFSDQPQIGWRGIATTPGTPIID
jgi:putative GTP pyrophosphokinase